MEISIDFVYIWNSILWGISAGASAFWYFFLAHWGWFLGLSYVPGYAIARWGCSTWKNDEQLAMFVFSPLVIVGLTVLISFFVCVASVVLPFVGIGCLGNWLLHIGERSE